MKVLRTQNLTKYFASIRAVEDLSLEVHAGQIYGLLGPNGSGKTTTLGMILGIIRPDSGLFEWFEGTTGSDSRRRLGALLETPNFYPYLNADDNLAIVRHIKRSSEANFDELLDLVQLKDRRSSKFLTYSLGMKQRLAIAAAMVGNPDALILDEPTNGLDPEGIADVRQTVREIAAMGKTVIFASHMLDEVEKVCSHVAILKKGKLLANGPVGAILSDDVVIEVGAENMQQLLEYLPRLDIVHKMQAKEGIIEIVADGGMSAAELNQKLISEGIKVNHLVLKKQRLEDEFLEIIK